MKSRILSFGCSFTVGQGVLPSQAWPAVVADTLKLPLLNYAVLGSSNRRILYEILTADIQSNDIVLIMWSGLARYMWIDDNRKPVNVGIWMLENPDAAPNETVQQAANNYYMQYTDGLGELDTALCIHHANVHLKNNGVRAFNFSFDGTKFCDSQKTEMSAYKVENPYLTELGIPNIILAGMEESTQYPPNEQDHPSVQAHAAFAKRVLKKYIVPELEITK
jgi:hypothetical protein